MLSIVVPALNEEKYISLLLDSIKSQDFDDYEVIVADAGSADQTVPIVKSYQYNVIKGGLPARGRNQGAKYAKGDLLLFLDADVVLPEHFLQKTLKEFTDRSLDVASFRMIPLPLRLFSSIFMDIFYNGPIIILEKALPHAAVGILIKRDVFDKIEGFDENITLAEDHYLARRAQKLFSAKCGIIRSVKIFVSDRRFRKDGWVKTGVKYLLCELHLVFIGPVKSNLFNYKFNHYEDEKKSR